MSIQAYYINLDTRPDRRAQMEADLERMGIPAERFAAIPHSMGHVGCSKSHIEVLRLGHASEAEHVLVFEDDYEFLVDKAVWDDTLTAFLKAHPKYSVLVLYNYRHEEGLVKPVLPTDHTGGTAGYMVHRDYIHTLLNNFTTSANALESTGAHWQFALDQYWRQLMVPHQWFKTCAKVGRQRSGFSDVERKHIDKEGY
jgi:glycosyl transferase family 25